MSLVKLANIVAAADRRYELTLKVNGGGTQQIRLRKRVGSNVTEVLIPHSAHKSIMSIDELCADSIEKLAAQALGVKDYV